MASNPILIAVAKQAKAPKRGVRKVPVRKAKKKPAEKRALPNRADALEVVAPPETKPIRKPRKKPRQDDYAAMDTANGTTSKFRSGRCPFASNLFPLGCVLSDTSDLSKKEQCYLRYDSGYWSGGAKFAPDWCPLRQGEVTVRLVEDRPPPVASDSDGNEKSSVPTIRVDLLEIEKPRRR